MDRPVAERGQALVDEVKRQICEAEASEATRALEVSRAQMQEAKAYLDQLGNELTFMATKLATKIGEAEEVIADIRARNKKFIAAGRPDLQTKVPDIAVWKRHLQGYVR